MNIESIHTLGPVGTNCEAAAKEWRNSHCPSAEIYLYPTLEVAVAEGVSDDTDALLACIVYPDLHKIVFSNLAKMKLLECFVMPTHNMVLASKSRNLPRTIASHPAPINLLDISGVSSKNIVHSDSNAAAAKLCFEGKADACITTEVVANKIGLIIQKNYGPVEMGFSLHVPREESLSFK